MGSSFLLGMMPPDCLRVKSIPFAISLWKGMKPSIHMLSAVDRERRSRDELRLVRGQERHTAGNVHGPAQAAHRDTGDDLLQNISRHRAHHVCIDVTWRYGIHGDAEAGSLLRQRLGEAVDAGLGGGIVDLAILAGLASDAADIDDAAEPRCPHAVESQ